MEYLRRLEYERKMEKLYKRKTSFQGFALAEHSQRVKRNNAFESSTLRTRMGLIRKEEVSCNFTRKKTLDVIHNLEGSINGPVSCTIPGTTRAELLASARERVASSQNRSRLPARSAGSCIKQPSLPTIQESISVVSSTSNIRDTKSAPHGQRVPPDNDPKSRYRKAAKKGKNIGKFIQPKITYNRKPRSRLELQSTLTYDSPKSQIR